MLETILAILAAIFTMFIAGLLVRKQNTYQEKTIELDQKNKDNLIDIADEVSRLTKNESEECTLSYLENRMEMFNETISIIQHFVYTKKGRNKSVKRKKSPAND